TNGLRRVEVHDASLQPDIAAAYEKIQYDYDRSYNKLSAENKQEAIDQYRTVFEKYFDHRGVLHKTSNVANIVFLLRMSEDLNNAMKGLGIEVPKHLVMQSLAAVYMNQHKTAAQSEYFQNSRAAQMINAQRGMFREGLYL